MCHLRCVKEWLSLEVRIDLGEGYGSNRLILNYVYYKPAI